MRTQYYCAASLDGYIADPDDGLDWLTGYEGAYAGAADGPSPLAEGGYDRFYAGVSALVSGSVTYEWLLRHVDDWPYAGKPYWVLTSRDDLPVPEGEGVDVRFARGPLAEVHAQIAAAAGEGNLWIVGGGGVASQFAAAGWLDEVILTTVPVVLGAGKPLFSEPMAEPLRLAGTRTFANGMVELRYTAG